MTDDDRLLALCAYMLRTSGDMNPRMTVIRILAYLLELSENDCLLGNYPSLSPDQSARVEDLCRKRAQGVPLQYLTGSAWFFGARFEAGPGVMVPRPDTEILVNEALARFPPDSARARPVRFADLCTGSGCVGLSIALAYDKAGAGYEGVLTDMSADALKYAQANVRRHSPAGLLSLSLCDLFPESDTLIQSPFDGFDLIVSNPPYIPVSEIAGLMPEVAVHEPRLALDGGEDGLMVIRRILQLSAPRLHTDGWLLIEHGYDQGVAVRGLFLAEKAYDSVETFCDFGGNERVTAGRRAECPMPPESSRREAIQR
ncbi:MAG TPA: peptide chain release factor N(5)-glutamine methyltransferase [Clostridia bacterium]